MDLTRDEKIKVEAVIARFYRVSLVILIEQLGKKLSFRVIIGSSFMIAIALVVYYKHLNLPTLIFGLTLFLYYGFIYESVRWHHRCTKEIYSLEGVKDRMQEILNLEVTSEEKDQLLYLAEKLFAPQSQWKHAVSLVAKSPNLTSTRFIQDVLYASGKSI